MPFEISYFRRQKNKRLRRQYQALLPDGWQKWFEGKEFSTDWTTGNYPFWCGALQDLRNQPVELLEIGSWEGRSAVFLLNYLTKANITCVDTFAGCKENLATPSDVEQLPFIEQRFERNLAQFGSRTTKAKGPSLEILGRLASTGKKFDVIYVDGSHERDMAMGDSILSWQMLNNGGYLIWDDYGGGHEYPDADHVKSAIDVFLKWHRGEFDLIHKGYQVIIRRTLA